MHIEDICDKTWFRMGWDFTLTKVMCFGFRITPHLPNNQNVFIIIYCTMSREYRRNYNIKVYDHWTPLISSTSSIHSLANYFYIVFFRSLTKIDCNLILWWWKLLCVTRLSGGNSVLIDYWYISIIQYACNFIW